MHKSPIRTIIGLFVRIRIAILRKNVIRIPRIWIQRKEHDMLGDSNIRR
jgi:hypothetical protein